MVDIFEDDSQYVCISHNFIVPCPMGDNHLVSNWPSDVAKVLDIINHQEYNNH